MRYELRPPLHMQQASILVPLQSSSTSLEACGRSTLALRGMDRGTRLMLTCRPLKLVWAVSRTVTR